MLGKPYVIAKVPSGAQGHEISPHARDVFILSRWRKQRQPEVAVAIDRQSVNIYNYQSSQLVTSYIISPQTQFTCPPCSFLSQASATQASYRYTYLAVKDPDYRLLCFREEIRPGQAMHDLSTFSINLEIKLSVAHLDVLCKSTKGENGYRDFVVVANHTDGTVSAYNADLSSQLWRESPASHDTTTRLEGHRLVRCSILLSEKEALRGILKGRADVLKPTTDVSGGEKGFLLSIDEHEHEGLTRPIFRIYSIDIQSASDTFLTTSKMNEILSQPVPVPAELSGSNSTFSIDISNGNIRQCSTNSVVTYDIQSLVPRLLHTLKIEDHEVMSCQAINSSLLAVADEQVVRLYAMPFATLQASLELTGYAKVPAKTRKPTASDHTSVSTTAQLISFSEDDKVLLALFGDSLLALPILGSSADRQSRKRTREGLLLSSLGRSAASLSTQQTSISQMHNIKGQGFNLTDTDWNELRARLDKLFMQNDRRTFEKLLLEDLNKHARLISPVQSQKIGYCLAKIFRVAAGSTDGIARHEIEVSFWPGRLCDWLVDHEILTTDAIESALKKYGELASFDQLAVGTLTQALIRFDSSLKTLLRVVGHYSIAQDTEVCHALLAVSRQVRHQHQNTGVKLLTLGEESEREPLESFTNGELSSNQPGTPANSQLRGLLYILLAKLRRQTSTSMARLVRQTFTNFEIRSFINILRVELAKYGWLSLSDEDYHGLSPEQHTEDQITLIAHALNLFIDALGPAGWILSSDAADDLGDSAATISYMKAEVSAALEGIEEATYLRQMLSEVLLRGKDTLKEASREERLAVESAAPVGRGSRPQKPFLVQSQVQDSFLPLGTKRPKAVARQKVGAGGEILVRSKRAVGHSISQKVGKYSFERINI